MKSPNAFTTAKEKYLRQIDENNKVISQRKAENVSLESKLRLLEEIEQDAVADKTASAFSDSAAKRYAGMRLSDAALDAVRRLFIDDPNVRIGRGRVSKYMRDNGYVAKGVNFPISVDIALRRLAEKGNLESYLDDGKRGYRPLSILL